MFEEDRARLPAPDNRPLPICCWSDPVAPPPVINNNATTTAATGTTTATTATDTATAVANTPIELIVPDDNEHADYTQLPVINVDENDDEKSDEKDDEKSEDP